MVDADTEPFTLRNTIVNRPLLEHTPSKQSVTASEDYQSAHSEPSDASRPSTAGDAPVTSSMPSYPTRSGNGAGAESFLPPTQAAYNRLQQQAAEESAHIRRKPVGSGFSPSSSSDDSNGKISQTLPPPRSGARAISPSITPGESDSPYIRFALDQLTRDEDVRGSRRYMGNDRWTTSAGGIVGPIGVPSIAPPAAAYTPYRPTQPMQPSDRPAQQPISRYDAPRPPPAAVGATTRLIAMGPSFSSTRSNDADETYATPLEYPQELRSERVQPVIRTGSFPEQVQKSSSNPDAVFVPFDRDVPALRFIPAILRPLWLGIYTFLCVLVLVGLAFSGGYSGSHLGLFAYSTFGGARYFVFEYLPLMICMFLLVWLFQIQVAIQRIAPFIAMASYNSKSRSAAPLMEMQPTNFFLPKLFYFRAGQSVIGLAMIAFWLQIFTPPLFASLYNVYYFGTPNSGEWRWVAVQGIVWTLFTLYLLLVAALIVLGLWLWRQRTGLKWDPRSLADLIAMVDRSNISEEYASSELFSKSDEFRNALRSRTARLGYWTTSDKPNDVFYGIGEEGGPTRLYSLQAGQLREKTTPIGDRSYLSPDTPTSAGLIPTEEDDEYARLRFRCLPWYLTTGAVLLWIVGGIVLWLAFIIVSFVNNAVVHGFTPLLPVAPDSAGFSSTNFFYSFIPALIGQLIFLSWLSIDYAFRRLQPYAAMSSALSGSYTGATAEKSLLLDYTSRLPFSVTIVAVFDGNYRVAWFSFLSLIAACFPILGGGCFWAQFYIPSQMVRVAVNPSGYYALCVFVSIFAFSLPLILLRLHKRRLPHACTTLAEQISWLYGSHLLGERAWRGPAASKAEMASRLMTANTAAERDVSGGRFTFGRFVGRDGIVHIGIDRIGRAAGNLPMSQRSWRRDDGLTTLRSEKPPYRPTTLPAVQGGPSNIVRSESGRFVPIPAKAAARAKLDTIYSEGSYESPECSGSAAPSKARVAPPRPVRTHSSPYHERNGSSTPLLPQTTVAHEPRDPHSASSSVYPSGVPSEVGRNSRLISDIQAYMDQRNPYEPAAATSGEPYATYPHATIHNDSMLDLAESDKPEHVRRRESGQTWQGH